MGWPHEIDNGQNVLSLSCVEGVPLWCRFAQFKLCVVDGFCGCAHLK
jgi:hypothetical protein